MSGRIHHGRPVSPAARVFSNLQADDALLPVEASVMRKSSALFLALLILGAVPLFWAANAAGVIGDLPAAVASSNSGPGSSDDDDDRLGPGDGDDDDDRTFLRTNDTSANNRETRGTTRDGDTLTNTKGGTNDTSRNGNETRGTTKDNDTRTDSSSHTNDNTDDGGANAESGDGITDD